MSKFFNSSFYYKNLFLLILMFDTNKAIEKLEFIFKYADDFFENKNISSTNSAKSKISFMNELESEIKKNDS